MNSTLTSNLKSFSGRLAAASALALALGVSGAAACSLANWSSTGGAIVANQPNGAAGDPAADSTNIPRYAGLCGSQSPAGGASFVQDDRPGGINRIIARFYVFNNGAASPQVYGGFSDTSGGGPLFNVAYTGSDIVFTSGGASVSDSFQSGWNSVEVDWASGGAVSLIVNGGATQNGSGAATGSLSSVRLGNLNGAAGGAVNFDGYEAHLSTPVGRICNCNANGSSDDVVSVQDIIVISNEAGGGGALASGTPDCNEDGVISVQDIIVASNIAGSTGMCVL